MHGQVFAPVKWDRQFSALEFVAGVAYHKDHTVLFSHLIKYPFVTEIFESSCKMAYLAFHLLYFMHDEVGRSLEV
jgi:hypothetical protein